MPAEGGANAAEAAEVAPVPHHGVPQEEACGDVCASSSSQRSYHFVFCVVLYGVCCGALRLWRCGVLTGVSDAVADSRVVSGSALAFGVRARVGVCGMLSGFDGVAGGVAGGVSCGCVGVEVGVKRGGGDEEGVGSDFRVAWVRGGDSVVGDADGAVGLGVVQAVVWV